MTTIQQTIHPTHSLGALVAEHGATQVRHQGNLWSGLAFIFLGLIALGVGVVAAVTETGAAAVSFCSGVGLLSLAGGAWAVWTHRQEQAMAVQAYVDGLVWQKNGRTTTMRWDEVLDLSALALYNKQLRRTFYTYTLKDAAGQTMRLNLTPGHLDQAEQLADLIQQEVTRRQLGRAITALKAGQPVHFGPLTITNEGIENGRKHLPWSQFAGAAISLQGHFVVRAHQQTLNWTRVDMVKMPNVFTFVVLAQHLSKQATA